ncbi:MAG: deoxynucleoside kinase [Ignavibacteriales bacterium]|nr:deoxynucleoside kinase [Ignavibacteriales bacterium]
MKTGQSKQIHLVSIMGCHGVGKSTVAKALSIKLGFSLLPKTKSNPFSKSAILSFIHYIVERKRQHDLISKYSNGVVTDRYGFLDTSIYVDVLLKMGYCNEREQELFARIVNNLEPVWITPTYLIILTCSSNLILQRLERRRKSSSRHFNPFDKDYVHNINEAFAKFGQHGIPPRFLAPRLTEKIHGVKRLMIDTSELSISQTLDLLEKELYNAT